MDSDKTVDGEVHVCDPTVGGQVRLRNVAKGAPYDCCDPWGDLYRLSRPWGKDKQEENSESGGRAQKASTGETVSHTVLEERLIVLSRTDEWAGEKMVVVVVELEMEPAVGWG
jgi:hypothetical protein